jgi:2-polyprenyl-3-methyl-5-hydroxy-6-metoxy-1,4-benzoquinol methylase
MNSVGPSEWLWKEGAGYYRHTESELLEKPYLPSDRFLRDQRIMRMFQHDGRVSSGSEVLEIGCGRSPWLPYLAKKLGCRVSGIDIEAHAAKLASANLAGSGVTGQIYCRDGFDVRQNKDLWGQFDLVYSLGVVEHLDDVSNKLRALACFLKPGGRVLSMVPNLQGINWVMQRFGSLPVLRAHVVYTTDTLTDIHEQAGYQTEMSAYLGFFDGFLTNPAGESPFRQGLHARACRVLGLCGAAWSRLGLPTKESAWAAPLVVYVGTKPLS